jgi:glutaredoxin
MNAITVYGADWCEDTQATRAHLDGLGLAYQYVNVDADPKSKEWIKAQNNGKQQTPTVDVGGQILIEPEDDELDEAIRRRAGSSR